MKYSNNDDVLLGSTQSIKPSQVILAELLKNGKSPSEIEIFLKTGFPVYENEALHCYIEAHGYYFEWGHILEDIAPIEGDESHNCVFWNFCFDDLLKLYHAKGYFLDDLSRFVFYLFTSEICRPKFMDILPDFIMVGEGNEVSTFEFIVFETQENNFNDIEMAREWLASFFLIYIVDAIVFMVERRTKNMIETLY